MSGVLSLVGELLSRLNAALGLTMCPGEWLWTTAVAGALFGLAPVLAAVLVALVRQVMGNRYSPPTTAFFGLLGAVGAVVPLLGFAATASVLAMVAAGAGGPGLDGADVASLQQGTCLVSSQADYLGGGRTVGAALTALPGPDLLVAGRVVALLVVLPLLALVVAWALARLAVRRGPRWPGRLLWVPFLAVLAGTMPLVEGAVGQLWMGYLAVTLPGTVLVALVGRPRHSVLEPKPESDPPVHPAPESRPRVVRPPTRLLPPQQPTAVPAGTGPRLAADPGPLPPTLRGVAVDPPRPVAAPPATGDRFRRVRPIGGGGFGTVWLARDTVLDRDVAVKMARAPDADTERRIRREARALAAVHHPHCVRVHDILSDLGGVPGLAIVMEYVPGRSLAEEVTGGAPLSDTAGAHLWSTLAGALAAAHAQGVLHRDVKPSNVIIDPAGRAHLIDFGIARAAGDATLTATGIVVGTPDYLAPEVAAGGVADTATDSWQLAATVSFALSAQPPRGRRADPAAALLAAANQEPLTHLPPRTAHRALLERALHPDPARRPTLVAVQEELGQWLERTGRPADGPVTVRLPRPAQ